MIVTWGGGWGVICHCFHLCFSVTWKNFPTNWERNTKTKDSLYKRFYPDSLQRKWRNWKNQVCLLPHRRRLYKVLCRKLVFTITQPVIYLTRYSYVFKNNNKRFRTNTKTNLFRLIFGLQVGAINAIHSVCPAFANYFVMNSLKKVRAKAIASSKKKAAMQS